MIITDTEVFFLKIPLKATFSHHLAVRNTSESLLVALADDEGNTGYGESTPRLYVTGETPEGTLAGLQMILEAFDGAEINTVADIAWLLDGTEGLDRAPSVRCALELALLDLLGKNKQQFVFDMLGEPQAEFLHYSIAINGETPQSIEPIARQIAANKVRQVKLKVGPDAVLNHQNLAMLREILGENVEIRVDANAAWDIDEAVEHIQGLAAAGVFFIEQPLPPGGRDQWLALKKRISPDVRICVDESVCTLEDASWLASRNAVHGFNLKISKHGGLLSTFDVYEEAKENGLFCQLGCQVGETSILSAAGRTFALLTGDMRACEGSYGTMLLEADLTPNPLQIGFQGIGTLDQLKRAYGLGVAVDLSIVDAFLVKSRKS
ncbi:MAG: hypothetical protein IT270_20090 [Saprospiraceae bacterium]|nr:hypothetical protein [Saprospiraceae bacterium]